jgi:hypothetical protein
MTHPFDARRLIDDAGVAYGVPKADGVPRTVAQTYMASVAEGDITGHQAWSLMGYTTAATTTETDVTTIGTAYTYPASAAGLEVTSSDNTNDKAGGTGALTLRLYYLTALYAEKTADVTLNGTAVVATTETDIFRVNRAVVTTTGTAGKAAGTISIRNLADTPVYSQIAVGFTRSRNALFTVPAGKTLYVTSIAFSALNAGADKGARVILRATYDELAGARTTAGVLFYPYFEMATRNASFVREFEMPLKFGEKVDLKVSAIAEAASTTVTVALRGWMETN